MAPKALFVIVLSVLALGALSGCSGPTAPVATGTGTAAPTSADGESATFSNGYKFSRSIDIPSDVSSALAVSAPLSDGGNASLKLVPAGSDDLGSKRVTSFVIDTSAMPVNCAPEITANGSFPSDAPCFAAVLLTGKAADYDTKAGYKYSKGPGAEVVPLNPVKGGELITVTGPADGGKMELAILGGAVAKNFNVDVSTGKVTFRATENDASK